MKGGWKGRVLRVDLSNRSVNVLDISHYIPHYIGGKGFATKVAWDFLDGDVAEYDPENLLVFMTGPLTGTLAPTSGRGLICSVSPRVYPKPWYTRSNVGGFWAPELKYAGYDGLIVTGRSENPVYLFIRDGDVSLHDARDLWGTGTIATQRILKEIHGPKAQVLCIGPAGENRVRFSTIQHNLSNAAGQTGFGGVMGSKNLKAVVIRGSGGVEIADPPRFLDRCLYTEELVRNGPNIYHMVSPKMSSPDKMVCSAACPCNCEAFARKNFTAKFGPGRLTMLDHCMYPMHGWDRTEYKRQEAPEYRTEGVPPLGDCLDVQYCVEDLGLSIWDFYNFYPWFEVFVRNGIVSVGDLALDIEEPSFWFDFFHRIARREGVCDIFAEGVRRSADRLPDLGVSPEHFDELRKIAIFQQPGYGFPAHRDGRSAESQPSPLWMFSMLHWAFDTRDPMSSHHQTSFLEFIFPPHHGFMNPVADVSREKMNRTYERLLGMKDVLDEGFEPMEEKVRFAIWHQHRSCIKDSLLLCDWIFPRTFASYESQAGIDGADELSGDIDLEAKLFSPATGVEMDSEDLERCGERIYNLERALHIRNYGRNRRTDESIEWLFELPEKSDGTKLDKPLFDRIVDLYYDCRGWPGGRPSEDTLRRLGMDDVLRALYG